MEQISMFDTKKQETEFFEILKKLFKENREDASLTISERKQYHKISFNNLPAADIRVCFNCKQPHFAVSPYNIELIKELDIKYYQSNSKGNTWLYIHIASPKDIENYKELLLAIYDKRMLESASDSFDCCSRYQECSDAKECVNPYEEINLKCNYRLKLKNNTILYGKNRNV